MFEQTPPPAEQAEIFKATSSPPLTARSTWCVVSFAWLEAFHAYTTSPEEAPHPGPLVNDGLVEEGKDSPVLAGFAASGSPVPAVADPLPSLRKGLVEGEDYTLVPKALYDSLHEWYGGGPEIARSVVAVGARRDLRVDLYPLTLYAVKYDTTGNKLDSKTLAVFVVSGYTPVNTFRYSMMAAYNAPPAQAAIWVAPGVDAPLPEYKRLSADELRLPFADLGIQDGTLLVIDLMRGSAWNLDGLVAKAKKGAEDDASGGGGGGDKGKGAASSSHASSAVSAARASSSTTGGAAASATRRVGGAWSRSSYGHRAGNPPQVGATGLSNLGNTCFMNSALQCLSNTSILTEFFRSGQYANELNVTNPLGMEGKLASVYAQLVADLWSGKYLSVSPTKFKAVIGKFAPQFSGYAQQDSQELLGFLLDGLHEDLNRVLDKPPTEKLESDGRPDEEVAAESWQRHLMRNQSFIVDTFQAQFKSTVVCPEPGCGRVSITFDPYLYLQLPLPVTNSKVVQVLLAPADESGTYVKYGVEAPVHGTLGDVRKALSEMSGIPERRLVFADVYGSRMLNVLPAWRPVRQMRAGVVQRAFVVEHEVKDVEKPVYTYAARQAAARAKAAALAAKKAGEDEGEEEKEKAVRVVQVIQRKYVKSAYQPSKTKTSYRVALFGVPVLFSYVEGELTNAELRAKVVSAVRSRAAAEDPGAEIFESEDVKIIGVTSAGTSCAFCPATKRCQGCEIPDDDEPATIALASRHSVAVQWGGDSASSFVPLTGEVEAEEHASVAESAAKSSEAVDLGSCLQKFSKEETLSEDDMWYCSSCGDFRQATKKMEIWSTPDIIVIQLKRFTFTARFREKISCVVDFPIEGLDLSDHVLHPNEAGEVYDLFGVSRHSGGLGGGHYTAVAKNSEDGEWYNYNDSHVSSSDAGRVVDASAYLLFYERRGARFEKQELQTS